MATPRKRSQTRRARLDAQATIALLQRDVVEPAERILRSAEFPINLESGSEDAYAYRILWYYEELVGAIEAGNADDALRRAFSLGALLAEAHLGPEAFARAEALEAATKARQNRAREWKDRVRALGSEIRETHPDWRDARIATLIRQRLDHAENDIGRPPEVRTIRGYLKT